MQLAILSDHHKVGNFVKQGFFYENMYPDFIFFPQMVASQSEIQLMSHKYKVVVLYSNNYDFILELTQKIALYFKDVIIFVLMDVFDARLLTLKDEKKIHEYFLKPFHFRFIAGKIRAHLYNFQEGIGAEVINFRDLSLNLQTRELSFKDEVIQLRNKEFALLHFLMINRGKLLSRMMILENVWDSNANIFTNTVDVHMSRLRKILRYGEGEAPYIQTIPCSGYIFT